MSAPPVLDDGLRALVRLSAAVAASARTELMPFLDRAIADADPDEVEEALLQSHLFTGFPATLNAFALWRERSGLPAPPDGEAALPESAWADRGAATCLSVYGRAYEPLRQNIGRLSPAMERWMIEHGYGTVLGRPGLALGRRECCIAAILAVQNVPVQLRSHLRGALRCGIARETVDAVLDEVEAAVELPDAAAVRATWKRVLGDTDPSTSEG
jgi:4-carboxymuconolactone decarboxylase